jgi:hypothetical protein
VVSDMQSKQTSHIREDLTEKCSAILLGYRKYCAASTALSQVSYLVLQADSLLMSTVYKQLIIPEAFRALPVYALGILKSKPLKGQPFLSLTSVLSQCFVSSSQRIYRCPKLLRPQNVVHAYEHINAIPLPTPSCIARSSR